MEETLDNDRFTIEAAISLLHKLPSKPVFFANANIPVNLQFYTKNF